jgi:CRP-like cAMP-binding protein
MSTLPIPVQNHSKPILVSPPCGTADHRSTKPVHQNFGLAEIARQYATDIRSLQPFQELFAEGELSDNVFVVLEGWLFQYRILEDGRRQILDYSLPGAILGYQNDAGEIPTCTAEALTSAVVAVIPRGWINDLIIRKPEIALPILTAVNASLQGAFDSLTDIGRRSAREAVAHFLLRMERRVHEAEGAHADGSIRFPLIQEHIGDALGLTAVHVCRTLCGLRRDGLAIVAKGRLRVPDRDALGRAAGIYIEEPPVRRLAS